MLCKAEISLIAMGMYFENVWLPEMYSVFFVNEMANIWEWAPSAGLEII
jgi:hypothetical protein